MIFPRWKPFVLIVWRFRFLKFLTQIVFEFQRINLRVGPQQTIRALHWTRRDFQLPAPNFVKWSVLRRWGGLGTWIETGTYLGETTEMLSEMGNAVYSIEPSIELATNAIKKFKMKSNVNIRMGTSEKVLGEILGALNDLEKEDVCFWLDGHYSSGFTHLGERETPIVEELAIIESYCNEFSQFSIFIDDFRAFASFSSCNSSYPSRTSLVEWADRLELDWTIEYDIFIITNRR